MRYVQYYKKHDGELMEECGDRAVVILDKRNKMETSKADAIKFNGYHRPFYDAYQIYEGESFCRSTPVTKIINL